MKPSDPGTQAYIQPLLKQLSLRPMRSYVMRRARRFLELISPEHSKEKPARPPRYAGYEAPRLTKLSPEQAKLKLLGHLSVGDEGARDLLDLLFPDPVDEAAVPD